MASRLLVHNVCEHWTREQGSNVCLECRHLNGGYREASAEEVADAFVTLREADGSAEKVRRAQVARSIRFPAGYRTGWAEGIREALGILGLSAILEVPDA